MGRKQKMRGKIEYGGAKSDKVQMVFFVFLKNEWIQFTIIFLY